MFLFPFWFGIPPRKTSCHVSLVSCQSGMVLSVLTSRSLTALPFHCVGWPQPVCPDLGPTSVAATPVLLPVRRVRRDGGGPPLHGDVNPIHLVKPISARFCTVKLPVSPVTGILLGEILRLHQYLVLRQAPTRQRLPHE